MYALKRCASALEANLLKAAGAGQESGIRVDPMSAARSSE